MDEYKKKMSKDLDRLPEARTFKIESLLSEVKRGRVRIPPFQRALRWDDSDRQKLLDSLYRGYPVGTLLFWETHAPATPLVLGRFSMNAPEQNDALWVVDGQQRIIALLETLLPYEEGGTFFFDLDKEEQMPIKKDPKKQISRDPSRWLPMTKVVDSEHLLQWLFDQQPSPERRQEAIRVGKRIREYEIPAYIIRTESEEIPREVFGRINAAGKAMRRDEVFDAFHRARAPQSTPTGFPQIAAHLRNLAFGDIPHEILFRVLFAILGREHSRDDLLAMADLPSQEIKEAYPDTAKAAKRTVIFLKEKASIPHFELLPYKQTFVFLSKFFHHHPSPQPRSEELLTRWLWRGALSQKHRGTVVSERKTLHSVDPEDEEGTIQAWLASLGEKKERYPSLQEKFNLKNADSKLVTTALLSNEPRELLYHKKLSIFDLLDKNSQGSSRFFKLVTSRKNPSQWQQSIVNRLLHPPINKMLEHLNRSPTEVLRSHFLTRNILDLLSHHKFDDFFQQRAQWMEQHCLSFFRRQARWEETDRPSMRYLIAVNESW